MVGAVPSAFTTIALLDRLSAVHVAKTAVTE